ncbi:MAG: hypothetical protein IPJ81_15375 [Chitinophagaceae bacterium]|nr:hypothetical protein [Chitinophagaceae bacterium]
MQGEWVIEKGWFNEDTLSLEKLDTIKNKELSTVLIFSENNRLELKRYNPEDLGFCGFSFINFDSSFWSLNDYDDYNKEIYFDIKGVHTAVNDCKYKVSYSVISFSPNKIILKKHKNFLIEEKRIGK